MWPSLPTSSSPCNSPWLTRPPSGPHPRSRAVGGAKAAPVEARPGLSPTPEATLMILSRHERRAIAIDLAFHKLPYQELE